MTNGSDLEQELTPEACSAAVSQLPKEGSLEYIAGCVYDLASDAVVEAVKRNHSTGAAERQREGFDIMRQITVPYIEDNLIWGGVQRQLFLPVPSIILAGSPPVSDPAAGPLQCGSWARRIPG